MGTKKAKYRSIKKENALKAIKECDELGRAAFLKKHGCRKAEKFMLLHKEVLYDSKAIVRAAYVHQYGSSLPKSFVGGQKTVVPLLKTLRFQVVNTKNREEESSRVVQNEDDESAFPEGKKYYGWHRRLERDPKVAVKAKKKRRDETGRLACEVCGFDFLTNYGERGDGFIEAHHTKPISTLDGKEKTLINDIALVCSNCHRMLHRGKPLMTVEQLKTIAGQICDA